MNKLVYLLHSPKGLGRGRFCSLVLEDLVPRLLDLDPAGLKVSLNEPGLPRPLFLPVKRTGLALVSIWTAPEARTTRPWNEAMGSLGFEVAGYRVEESTPRAYDRSWPDGERTPGAALLTLFRKRKALSRDDFVRTWHEGHSPMALEFHPLWNYLRNVVEEPVTAYAPPWAGIVEEHFRAGEDLTDPRRFFGGALVAVPRLAHILAQTSTFLDLPTLENYVLAEYHVRSVPGGPRA